MDRLLTAKLVLIVLTGILITAGCIDVSPSDVWLAQQNNSYFNSTFNATVPQFQGAGTDMSFHYFKIYELITDPDLADERYRGGDTGVKVTIAYNLTTDPLQDTLWWHEMDATKIAKAFYNGENASHMGFVAVAFRYAGTNEDRLMLRLDACDAKRFAATWNNDGYIRFQDWSDAALMENSRIDPYEDPATYYRVIDAPCETEIEIPPHGSDILQTMLLDSTKGIYSTMEDITKDEENLDYLQMRQDAAGLITESAQIKKEINALPLETDLETVRDKYLRGLEQFWTAGQYYWYGAKFLDGEAIGTGNAEFDTGKQDVNSALDALSLQIREGQTLELPSDKILNNALGLYERYIYTDPNGINDISLRICEYQLKNGYILEDGSSTEMVTAEYGYKYMSVLVEVYHAGYRGGGSEMITTPKPTDFSLVYRGEQIINSAPAGYIRKSGPAYAQTNLLRKEYTEGTLLFLIPSDFNPEEAYIQVNLGTGGKPVWKFS